MQSITSQRRTGCEPTTGTLVLVRPKAATCDRQQRVATHLWTPALSASGGSRPTPVGGDDEMLAPKRTLADLRADSY